MFRWKFRLCSRKLDGENVQRTRIDYVLSGIIEKIKKILCTLSNLFYIYNFFFLFDVHISYTL